MSHQVKINPPLRLTTRTAQTRPDGVITKSETRNLKVYLPKKVVYSSGTVVSLLDDDVHDIGTIHLPSLLCRRSPLLLPSHKKKNFHLTFPSFPFSFDFLICDWKVSKFLLMTSQSFPVILFRLSYLFILRNLWRL